MNSITRKFLRICHQLKISRVAIGVRDVRVLSSMDWPFESASESVFQHPDGRNFDGWPAIWEATRRAGVQGSCGNHAQRALKPGHGLEPGYYACRSGVWKTGPVRDEVTKKTKKRRTP